MSQSRRRRETPPMFQGSKPVEPGCSFNPFSALWRLFFAIDNRPPRNFFERRRRRFRARFFFLLGIAATLAVQAFLGGRR